MGLGAQGFPSIIGRTQNILRVRFRAVDKYDTRSINGPKIKTLRGMSVKKKRIIT